MSWELGDLVREPVGLALGNAISLPVTAVWDEVSFMCVHCDRVRWPFCLFHLSIHNSLWKRVPEGAGQVVEGTRASGQSLFSEDPPADG